MSERDNKDNAGSNINNYDDHAYHPIAPLLSINSYIAGHRHYIKQYEPSLMEIGADLDYAREPVSSRREYRKVGRDP